jgi:hypothetical protein
MAWANRTQVAWSMSQLSIWASATLSTAASAKAGHGGQQFGRAQHTGAVTHVITRRGGHAGNRAPGGDQYHPRAGEISALGMNPLSG